MDVSVYFLIFLLSVAAVIIPLLPQRTIDRLELWSIALWVFSDSLKYKNIWKKINSGAYDVSFKRTAVGVIIFSAFIQTLYSIVHKNISMFLVIPIQIVFVFLSIRMFYDFGLNYTKWCFRPRNPFWSLLRYFGTLLASFGLVLVSTILFFIQLKNESTNVAEGGDGGALYSILVAVAELGISFPIVLAAASFSLIVLLNAVVNGVFTVVTFFVIWIFVFAYVIIGLASVAEFILRRAIDRRIGVLVFASMALAVYAAARDFLDKLP